MCSRASRRVAESFSFCDSAWASCPFVSRSRSSRVRTRFGASCSRRRRPTTSSSSALSWPWRSVTSRSYSCRRCSYSEAAGTTSSVLEPYTRARWPRIHPANGALLLPSGAQLRFLRERPVKLGPVPAGDVGSGDVLSKRGAHMKVWIDQDLCTGDGLCEEIAPDVFTLLDDGLAYVKEGDKVYATAKGNPQGAEGLAVVPAGQEEAVIESAEECPGECIFI